MLSKNFFVINIKYSLTWLFYLLRGLISRKQILKIRIQNIVLISYKRTYDVPLSKIPLLHLSRNSGREWQFIVADNLENWSHESVMECIIRFFLQKQLTFCDKMKRIANMFLSFFLLWHALTIKYIHIFTLCSELISYSHRFDIIMQLLIGHGFPLVLHVISD